jgi:hypothetical protein
MQLADGQTKRFRWIKRDDMAAMYANSGTPNATMTQTSHQLTIGNDMGTNATVSQLDDNTFMITTNVGTTNTGITIFGATGGNAGLTQGSPPNPPPIDPRVLNKYLLASDLLEKFIADIGELGVKEGEVLSIPIELFINWLVCRAAEQDGHAAPDGLRALPSNVTPIRDDRCRCCGQFITAHRRQAGVLFCSDAHMNQHLAKTA